MPNPREMSGFAVRNKILLAVPEAERTKLSSRLEFVTLPTHTILNEAGQPIKFAYFINDGLVSFLIVMLHGKSVEVGVCGREGFVGVPLTAGLTTSDTRVVVQVQGSGFKISAENLLTSLNECPAFAARLRRFGQELSFQAAQMVACNQLHEVDERLARWLLMCHDRLDGGPVALTQEVLARMLGTRRASVTVAAGNMQKTELITYKRGHITVRNRAKLEKAACECYGTLIRQTEKWEHEG